MLSELAQRFGTPLYVIDERSLRQACTAYREALERHYPGPSLAVYASKANSRNCEACASIRIRIIVINDIARTVANCESFTFVYSTRVIGCNRIIVDTYYSDCY